jgi:hypothetical protein
MDIRYFGDVDITLNSKDIESILNGNALSGVAIKYDSKKQRPVNIYSSEKRFYCIGGLGEGFFDDVFQGWVLETPRSWTQLAFPWGEEEYFIDYSTIDITISKPALRKRISEDKGYFCGMARGSGSAHTIDRLNLRFLLNQ